MYKPAVLLHRWRRGRNIVLAPRAAPQLRIQIDNITACCSCLTSQPLDRQEKRRREKKKQQLSWLKVGQVETVREVSSRAPDGAGACLGFSPHTQGSTLQHVAPMKATCGPGRRRFTPETRCAPAQVSPFFFFFGAIFPRLTANIHSVPPHSL